ncbi:MAG: winged helix-turn-helix domain-containing protein [Sphingobacteriales bacterium]|nr:winged helix-turn-helix domain-containing protein [Sphingobacteriales bacterium]
MDACSRTTAYRTEIWRCIKREAGRSIFKSWGYTPQKPIRKAFEQKPEQVKQWLEKEYPAIKKRATKEKGTIYFGDETGMRSDHQAGRSYAPKGKTPW